MKIWEKWKTMYEEEAQLREQEREKTAQIARGMEKKLEEVADWVEELKGQKDDLRGFLKHYKEKRE